MIINNRSCFFNPNGLTSFEPRDYRVVFDYKKYHLSHTVPEKEKMLRSDRCRITDFIIGEPDYEKVYFKDTVLVTGHTPTGFIDPDYKGRIWKGNNHIATDCGAVFGNPLGCICLDTMEEIYVN